MKLLKTLSAFLLLVSLQIASAQWLSAPPPVEARMLTVVQGGVASAPPAGLVVANAWKTCHPKNSPANPYVVTISPSAGSLLVVGYGDDGNSSTAVTGITDNKSGGSSTYTQLEAFGDNGTNAFAYIGYTANIASGITSLSLASTNSGSKGCVIVYEVTGASATPAGTHDKNEDSSTPQTTPAITNATADAIYFAIGSNVSTNNPATLTKDGSWSIHANAQNLDGGTTGSQIVSMPYLIVSSSSSRSHAWTGENIWQINVIGCFYK